ncbi:hypothetical protein ACTFIV_008808 [Dictyostelium citrinum]
MFQKFSSTFDGEDSKDYTDSLDDVDFEEFQFSSNPTTSVISISSSIIKDGEIATTIVGEIATTVALPSTNSPFTTIPLIDSDRFPSTLSIKNQTNCITINYFFDVNPDAVGTVLTSFESFQNDSMSDLKCKLADEIDSEINASD